MSGSLGDVYLVLHLAGALRSPMLDGYYNAPRHDAPEVADEIEPAWRRAISSVLLSLGRVIAPASYEKAALRLADTAVR
ncbi:MAG: hypothetical protein U0821_21940 [Chloroflexota bacterium]